MGVDSAVTSTPSSVDSGNACTLVRPAVARKKFGVCMTGSNLGCSSQSKQEEGWGERPEKAENPARKKNDKPGPAAPEVAFPAARARDCTRVPALSTRLNKIE